MFSWSSKTSLSGSSTPTTLDGRPSSKESPRLPTVVNTMDDHESTSTEGYITLAVRLILCSKEELRHINF